MDAATGIREKYMAAIAAAGDEAALEAVRVAALGKKGEVSGLMRGLGAMPPEERQAAGPALNALKDELAEALAEAKARLADAALEARVAAEWADVTLPGRPAAQGSIHPVSQVMDEITAIFADLGFCGRRGAAGRERLVQLRRAQHPARASGAAGARHLLHGARRRRQPAAARAPHPHLAGAGPRFMEAHGVPCRIIAPGRVYRADYDQTHTPMFHQVEGLAIDRDISMANLKWVLEEFCRAFFEVDGVELKFRASHFPFTEPSAEVDIRCSWAGGQLRIGEGDDWMEILGSGMVHPKVLAAAGVDPEKWQGFAFGMGIDRLAMLKYGIPDLRAFFESDLRWLRHYGFAALDVPTLQGGISR